MSKKIDPNPSQITAIWHPHNSSAIVTAAAGSGKTTLLVHRVVRLLSDVSLDISADKLAIMTFTRNATKSMREKLNRELSEKISELSDKASAEEREQYDYLKKQMFSLRQAAISTIDAFCLKMIKENAEEFDLPLNFNIADSAKKSELQSQALKNAMQEFYGSDFTDDERNTLFFSFSFENDQALENAILNVSEKISCFPDPEQWISDAVDSYKDIQSVEKNYLPLLTDYLELVTRQLALEAKRYSAEKICDNFYAEIQKRRIEADTKSKRETVDKTEKEVYPSVKLYIKYDETRINSLISDFDNYKKNPDLARICALIDNLEANSKNPPERYSKSALNYNNKKLFNEISKNITERVDEMLKMKFDINSEKNALGTLQNTLKTFFKLLKRFMDCYELEKRNSGCIDFSDCERELYNKLSENGGNNEFRKQLSKRFSCIIVDEFQDSNNIQAEIFRLLGEGRLFYVGDVKQSIYSFRGADPYIMANLCDDPNSAFKTLPLNTNFRSRRAIIDTVNAAFNGLMTKKYGGVDYSKGHGLNLGCELPDPLEKDKELYCSELYLLSGIKQATSEDEDDKDMTMPGFVAAKIKELHDNPNFLISDGKDDEDNFIYRRAEYSDFIILLRTKGKTDCYRKALAELDIASTAPKGSNFFEADEVLLVYNYLKIIDNPHLKEEALKVMMSPIYRFTADEAAKIKLGILGLEDLRENELREISVSYRNRSFLSCINDCLTQTARRGKEVIDVKRTVSPKLERFQSDFKSFRNRMNSGSLDNLIRKIYDDTDLIAVVSAFEDSAGRVENIRKMQKLASDFEARGGGRLGDFLRFLDRARENSSKGVEEAARAESSANAVRIMTFHGSKGLEAPVCIMSELQNSMNAKDYSGNFLMNSEHFAAIKHTDIKHRRKSKMLAYQALSRFIREREMGDELRLLYVAMTRAQEKLIMVSDLNKDNYENFNEFIKSNSVDPALPNEVYETSKPFMCVLRTLLKYAPTIKEVAKQFYLKDIECKISAINISETKSTASPSVSANNTAAAANIPQSEITQLSDLIQLKYRHITDTEQQAKFTATELAHKHTAKPIVLTKPDFAKNSKTQTSGVETGNAYHHCMQHFPLDRVNTGMSFEETLLAVSSVIDELVKQKRITDVEGKTVNASHIAHFFQSELGRRMLTVYADDPGNVKREQSFYAEINGRDVRQDYDGVISIQGQIDMYFIENGEIVVVDYKSDTEKNLSKELENYKFQVEIYMRILKKLTGKKVKEMYLYALTDDKEIKV